jgi:peroxiredoxin Q/BCP
MAQLRQDYVEFVNRNAEVLVVGPEDSLAFACYWQKQSFPFVGLPDPDHRVANLYGQQVNLLRLGRLPALMVISKTGQIRHTHHGESMRDIPANENLLALLDQMNEEAR